MTAPDWDILGDQLAARAIAAGDPTGWFNDLYAAGVAGEVSMPWNRDRPHPLLDEWTRGRDAAGRRAVVVGCGLGADAEHLASLGFATTAFDVAETAVRTARDRHPSSIVDYRVADLLALPADWLRSFDLVVDVFTVQALPDPPRADAIVNVGRLVAPGGTLVAIAFHPDAVSGDVTGPPFPLSADEVAAYATDGLHPVLVEKRADPGHGAPRWLAEFYRPTG